MGVLDDVSLINIRKLDCPHILLLQNSLVLLVERPMLSKRNLSDLGIGRGLKCDEGLVRILSDGQDLAGRYYQ